MIKWVLGIVFLIIAGLDIYMNCYTEGYSEGIVDVMNCVNDILEQYKMEKRNEIMNKALDEMNNKIKKNWRLI